MKLFTHEKDNIGKALISGEILMEFHSIFIPNLSKILFFKEISIFLEGGQNGKLCGGSVCFQCT